MKRFQISNFLLTLLTVIAIALSAAYFSQAQTGGLRREPGFVLSRGTFVELACGGTVAARDALYLDSNGSVQKAATSGQTTALIGVANAACASGGSTQVQIAGVAEVVADDTVSVGDRVGAPAATAGRVKAVASTLAVAAGGTAVTSAAANGAIVTGDPGTSRVLGRALTAGEAGQPVSILLTIG